MKRILFTGFVVLALTTVVITFYLYSPLGSAREANPIIKPQAAMQPVAISEKVFASEPQVVIESNLVRSALIDLESKANAADFNTVDYSQEIEQASQKIIDTELTRPDAINASMKIYHIWTNADGRSKFKSDLALKNEKPFFTLLSHLITKAKISINPVSKEHLSNAEVFLGYKYLERDNTDEGFKWLTRAGVSGDKALAMHLVLKARRESNQPP